ncbi:hypothetical protein F6B41_25510 [Microbacterium lushaniae]|nr:hypothetical protein F6B41_33830 [Microbacterium lushaniae]KAA9149512.1 hypothetical protein F6B41_25510 [Microbacterium lushaniae]
MSGRNLDPHRIHHARHVISDDKVDASANAFRAIARGEFKRDRIDTTAPEGETWGDRTPAAVIGALARSRLIPDALALACEHAEPGVSCWPGSGVVGVCGARFRAAVSAHLPTFTA